MAGARSGVDRLARLQSFKTVCPESRESSDERLRELESQVANLEGEREGLMKAIFGLQKNIRSLVEERAAQDIDPRSQSKKAELKQVGKREAELSKKVSVLESQLENLTRCSTFPMIQAAGN